MLGKALTTAEALTPSSSPFRRDFCFPVLPDFPLGHLSCDPIRLQLRTAPSLPPTDARLCVCHAPAGPALLLGRRMPVSPHLTLRFTPFSASLVPHTPWRHGYRSVAVASVETLWSRPKAAQAGFASLPHLSFLSLCKTLVSPFGCH